MIRLPRPTYPACTLTYELAWDNAAKAYGNTAAIDARQRTVKDYLTYVTDTGGANDGQSILRSLDYYTRPRPSIRRPQWSGLDPLPVDAQDGLRRFGKRGHSKNSRVLRARPFCVLRPSQRGRRR